jgi:RimJ/RimL family protein N-acetyltransferase
MKMPAGLLRGARLRLTALEEDDVPIIASWDEDTQFLRLYDARLARPRPKGEVADWLKQLRQEDHTIAFGIRGVESNDLLGTVTLDGVLWPHRVCGIGIAIGERDQWGKGYGFEAAQLTLDFAFRELNLHRVTATVFNYNRRSIALVEKLGFQREGAFREYLERDGERHDMLLYGLLRPEWLARDAQA